MTTYIIDYSDPLKTAAEGFTIQPGTFNGPGNPSSKTPLRLFGQGALAWGESVDENMLRLLEHFASASPPVNPISGQLWVRQKLYWREGTSAPYTWYVYNFSASVPPTTAVWDSINVQEGSGPPPLIPTPSVGDYWFDSSNGTLWLYDRQYKQTALGWIQRLFITSPNSPTPSDWPTQDLVIYDEFTNAWESLIPPGIDEVIIGATPPAHSVGLMWYNTVTTLTYQQGMYVSDGTNWNRIAYLNTTNSNARLEIQGVPPNLTSVLSIHHTNVTGQGDNKTHFGYTNGANVENYIRGTSTRIDTPILTIYSNNISFQTSGSTISMGSNRVQDVASPIALTDAANKQYVDNGLANKVNKAGDTMTGFLTLNADPTAALHAATKQYVDNGLANKVNTTQTIALSGDVTASATAYGSGNITLSTTLATVPISKGGTGQTTQTAAFNALAPTTTKGDLIVHDGTNNVRLPVGIDGQVLTADSLHPAGIKWATPSFSRVIYKDLTTFSSFLPPIPAEVDIFSVTIPGGMLGTSNIIRIIARGRLVPSTFNYFSNTFRIYYGGSLIVDSNLSFGDNINPVLTSSPILWEVEAYFYPVYSNTIHKCSGSHTYTMNNNHVDSTRNTIDGIKFISSPVSGPNNTFAHNLKLAIAFPTSHSSYERHFVMLELLS